MKKIWPFSFYFLYFAAFSSLMPFYVLFYQRLGFGGGEIGLLTGIPPLITIIASPFWTNLADLRHWHKRVIGLGLMIAILVVLLLPFLTSFVIVFLLIILFNFFLAPVSSLADSATITMLGEERATYGRIRLGGTLGWGLFAPLAGVLVQNYGFKIGFWSFCAIMLANFFISQRFVFGSHEKGASDQGRIQGLLTSRRWINFLLVAFLGGLGGASVNTYLFPYMAELGAKESTMGLALTIATITELPIFFFGDRLVKRFTSYGLLMIAIVMVGIRSLLFGAVSTPLMVLLVQAFGGMIFPAMWLAGVSYADENAPAGLKSTAQGLFGAMTFGVGSAVGGFMGGPLLASIGGRGMFLVFGVVIFVGLAVAESLRRLLPDKRDLPQVVTAASDK